MNWFLANLAKTSSELPFNIDLNLSYQQLPINEAIKIALEKIGIHYQGRQKKKLEKRGQATLFVIDQKSSLSP